jgi:hypothetical protein
MPHDAKGRPLQVDDMVMVPFRVTNVCQGEDYCNVSLKSVATMPPVDKHHTDLANINSKMLLRANAGDDTSFSVEVDGEAVRLL